MIESYERQLRLIASGNTDTQVIELLERMLERILALEFQVAELDKRVPPKREIEPPF